MTDQALGDEAISTMVDIARMSGQNLNPEQRQQLEGLVADGLIEKTADAGSGQSPEYAVTAKGQKILDDRGVGANES